MKKLWTVLGLLALLVGLCGCDHFVSIMPGTDIAAAQTGDSEVNEAPGEVELGESAFHERALYDFIGWDSFASTYYDNTPVALSYYTPDQRYASPVFDRASIIAACDALRNMTVTGRAESEDPSDGPETMLTFTMANGDERSVTFAGGQLLLSTGAYTVTGGEALWNIAFPGYDNGFDPFDLYFSDSIRTFADSFYDNTPVSVGRRYNSGATLTSEDPEVVTQVFELLKYATVDRVESSPDQNIDLTQYTDYIFTMADGTYYTFTFVGPCLGVTVSNAYGPVYYWLNGVDELPDITILPESTIPTFEGGSLTALRTDIETAAAVANGEKDGVSVLGVYVNYVIDGQRSYLTLDGDTAASFVRQVTEIYSTGELAEEPSGDEITVYVTLSDMTGPILSFTGNTIQQLMGTNYICDSGDIADLRETVLELAKDEKNVGYITEVTTG